MRLDEIMTTEVQKVSPSDSIVEAAKKMKTHNIGCIPVCEGDKLIGVLTDRDIAIQAVATGKSPQTTKCEEVMSRELIIGSPELDVHEAAQIMADEQIRRLPVVDKGKLVGIVAIGDLAVEAIFVNEAGEALSDISKPTQNLH